MTLSPRQITTPTAAIAAGYSAAAPRLTAAAGAPVPLAIVTGASSGIGERVAMRLAERGYTTVLMARRAAQLDRVCLALRPHAPAEAAPVDLDDPDATARVFAAVLDRFGTPDLLVNCAGVGLYRLFAEHTDEDDHRIMRVNYHAPAQLIRMTLPRMVDRNRGLIVNVASIAVKMAPWGHAAYTASKAALVALTQTLAAEHRGTGVRFTYVNPGIVRTPYFDQPDRAELWRRVERYAVDPDLVARRIVGLLDRHRLELVVPRHYRVLDMLNALTVGGLHALVTRSSRPRP